MRESTGVMHMKTGRWTGLVLGVLMMGLPVALAAQDTMADPPAVAPVQAEEPMVASAAPVDMALEEEVEEAGPTIDAGDTAWMLVSAALVLLMTPGLAFFYGGLVRSKNVLNTMMMSFISLGFVSVLWALFGYSLAFGTGSSFIGDASAFFMAGIGTEPGVLATIPGYLFVAFQGTFAIITAALISGAIVERMRFPAYLLFLCLWTLLVYSPLAHMVWGGGWLFEMGALDFAGGTVVHINAAVAAAVAVICVGRRSDYRQSGLLPHNVPFVLLGSGLLWFGWFGFNAGSAGAANGTAGLAFATTMFAPAATITVWSLLDLVRVGKVTAVGLATAIVVGLVAVTPAAGLISPMNAILLGAIAAVPSYFMLLWRARSGFDDSLDVVAAHGVGGTVGALLTGVFADPAVNGGLGAGLLYGNSGQFVTQVIAVVFAIVFSAVASFVLLKIVGLITPLRADDRAEAEGLDMTQHGEEGYIQASGN